MQESPDNRSFIWIIDNADKIVYVNDAWLDFARENDAPQLSAAAVLDQPLWFFIQGQETIYLYKQIFAKLRAGQSPIKLPFRCDSPDCRRFMHMKISLLAGNAIHFLANFLRLEYRSPLDILSASGDRSEAFLRMCSWCKKVYLPDHGWVEMEEAIRALDLFGRPAMPQITHAICDSCYNFVRDEMFQK